MSKEKKLTASEIDGVNYRRSSTGQIILSVFAYIPLVLTGILLTYISYMASTGYGIATTVTGAVFTFLTIFDGVTDPIVAKFIDNFNTKHGKIRLLLFIGYGISAISVLLTYFIFSNKGLGVPVFVLLLCFFYIGYTIYCVTQGMINPILTNDPVQRPMVNVWMTLIGVFPPIIYMVYVSVFLLPKYGNEYTVPMLQEMCVQVLVVSLITLLISMIGLGKIDKPENFEGIQTKKEKVSFKDMVMMFKENAALRSYFFAAASDSIATGVSGQAVVTTLLGGVLLGDMAKNSTYSMVPMVIGMVFLFLNSKMNAKWGSKKGCVNWSLLAIAVSAATLAFEFWAYRAGVIKQIFTTPLLLIIWMILISLKNIFNNGNSNATTMMMADVIDYQCYLSGKYMPAAVTATYSFLNKLVSSVNSVLCMSLLALIGYTDTLPQPTDELTDAIFWLTMFITLGFPAIGWAINLISMKFNPLTKEKMVEVQATIADKKAEMQE